MSTLLLTWKHIPWWFCSSFWRSTSPVSGRAAPARRRWPGWWRRPCGCRAGTDPLHFQNSLSAEPAWSAHPHLQRDRGALPNAATKATEMQQQVTLSDCTTLAQLSALTGVLPLTSSFKHTWAQPCHRGTVKHYLPGDRAVSRGLNGPWNNYLNSAMKSQTSTGVSGLCYSRSPGRFCINSTSCLTKRVFFCIRNHSEQLHGSNGGHKCCTTSFLPSKNCIFKCLEIAWQCS